MPKSPLGQSHEFCVALGLFYLNWTRIELTIDYAICMFLKIPAKEAHFITASIDFGRRAAWLGEILRDRDFPTKPQFVAALNDVRGSKRNVFAHSYMSSAGDTVKFVERIPHGRFAVKVHEFDWAQFKAYVDEVAQAGLALRDAMGATDEEMDEFAAVALSFGNRS